MGKMYVANCTSQVQDFQYRLPESGKVFKQTIPIGQQIQVSGDLNVLHIQAIIEQHAKYSMVAVHEIDRTKPFIGLCYNLDKPVDMEKVRRALVHNARKPAASKANGASQSSAVCQAKTGFSSTNSP